jgi:hypothetical protein
MKRNRDLKAELVEAQLAARQWEESFIRAQRELEIARQMHSAIVRAQREDINRLSAELLEAIELMSEATDYVCDSPGDIIRRVDEFELKHKQPDKPVNPLDFIGVTEMHTTGHVIEKDEPEPTYIAPRYVYVEGFDQKRDGVLRSEGFTPVQSGPHVVEILVPAHEESDE